MAKFKDESWSFLSTWMNDRLAKDRIKNDNPDMTPEQTAMLRGRIQLLKEMIRLPETEARSFVNTQDQ